MLVASENPLGRAPEETCQEYGGTPPVAASETLYAVSAVTEDNVCVAMPRGSGGGVFAITESDSEAVATDCCESVTVTWNGKVPGWSIVPERIPVLIARESPLGRTPEETRQEYGRTPPVATNETLYAVSAVADNNV